MNNDVYCKECGSKLRTLDEHYKLPSCYDFILVCQHHPAELIFDLPEEELYSMLEL